jgi:acyl carrier protein
MSEIIEKLKEYMQEELEIDTADLEPGSALFSTGIIDSFSLVTLLTFIESTFEFRIGPTDVNLANFDSLERMHAYIDRHIDT